MGTGEALIVALLCQHEPLQPSLNQETAMRRTVTFPLQGVLLPEPASLCLVGSGIFGLAAVLRRAASWGA